MKFKRVQAYRSVFIAELHSDQVRHDGGPLRVLDSADGKAGGGIGIHVAYYIIDEFGEVLHPINAYFVSPVVAQAAADILIDTPKKFESRVSALLRYEKDFTKEF